MLDFQTIAVDFDGTLCYSKWPELDQPNLALIEYLQEWKRNGIEPVVGAMPFIFDFQRVTIIPG